MIKVYEERIRFKYIEPDTEKEINEMIDKEGINLNNIINISWKDSSTIQIFVRG